MSKKKSYMDRTNILSEGLLKMLGKLIPFKGLIKKAFSPKDKEYPGEILIPLKVSPPEPINDECAQILINNDDLILEE